MASLILFLCSLCIHFAIGYSSNEYIIGGYPANIRDFPYQVSIHILVNSTLYHSCGGAVITDKFIITAAHCLSYPSNIVYIFVGVTKLSTEGRRYTVEHAVHHANFNKKKLIHDIGLIGVKHKIIFNSFVKPISILRNNIPVGTILTVSGWGDTSSPHGHTPDTLQKLQIRVIELKDCKVALKLCKEPIQDSQICTFVKTNKGICHGDSGGPITLNGMLVGVVSWGKPCAVGLPDVNTRISKYFKWIKTTITKYCKIRICRTKKMYPTFVRIN